MISFPICKINLGLRVHSKRPDGYHDIETCFYPVPWSDVLEIIHAKTFSFTHTGNDIAGFERDNLCIQAYTLLTQDFNLGAVAVHLHKIIPVGAGLGGGASDAVHVLKMLNRIFNLNLPQDKLCYYAAQLGSDCPYFTYCSPMLGTGRGDVLEPLNLSLQGKTIVLVKPDIHISSAKAYKHVKPHPSDMSVREIIEGHDIANWKHLLINDFEKTVFKAYPVIGEIKEKMYSLGALYASMSGSGSAVYGIFNLPVDIERALPGMRHWSTQL